MVNLYKIASNIFCLKFDNNYDLGMHFLRSQEFYESPFPEFKGKDFLIIDYMEKYAKTYGDNVFSYPGDWDGFNIPSDYLKQCYFGKIRDMSKYDKFMLQVMQKISDNLVEYTEKYYLIGITDFNGSFEHEFAHALYSTCSSYKEECDKLIFNLDPFLKLKICDYLYDIGYTSEVFDDEIQAYLSTGFLYFYEDESFFQKLILKYKLKKASKPFVNLYDKYKITNNFEEIL